MSDPKERRLITYLQEQGLTCAIGDWIAGQGKISDLGNGDWKAIDARNMFLRRAGTDADTANPRLPGTYQSDALQDISGVFSNVVTNIPTPGNVSGAFDRQFLQNAIPQTGTGGGVQNILLNAARVARISTETRGPSTAVSAVILI